MNTQDTGKSIIFLPTYWPKPQKSSLCACRQEGVNRKNMFCVMQVCNTIQTRRPAELRPEVRRHCDRIQCSIVIISHFLAVGCEKVKAPHSAFQSFKLRHGSFVSFRPPLPVQHPL